MATPPDDGTAHDGFPPERPQAAKPSLDLLRSLTDEHVLRAVMENGRLTRAGIAVTTGISKPTISESARRLSAAGILVDTGERTSGRGRAGSYFTLAEAAGTALVVSIQPDGVFAEALDPFGSSITEAFVPLDRGAGQDEAARSLGEAARRARSNGEHFRMAVVSAADPVDRRSGRLVHLPDAPFMVGNLDPVSVLAAHVAGPVLVDNDVNWAARAERDAGKSQLDDFVYIHLGEGLGCAVVTDGDVRRGHRGVAGEIAHLVTVGPGGRATPLTEVFAALGLRRDGTTAIDVDLLRASLCLRGPAGSTILEVLARAVAGVLIAAIALADPHEIVIGGSWGRDVDMIAALGAQLATSPRSVPVREATVRHSPDEAGARAFALTSLRTLIATPRNQ